MQVGIVGAGNISATYVANLHSFDFVQVKSVYDMNEEAAGRLAKQFGIAASSFDDMLDDPGIGLIINLTTPTSHHAVSKKALQAGKHVYCEKPLGVSIEEGEELVALANAGKLRLGCAPDTFLGGGHQLTRRLIDEGRIGRVTAATAMLLLPGHEHWHPNPAFYYQRGGGPMFDMGPYYITSLVTLLGPVREVLGTARITRAERVIGSEPRRGEVIKVEVPTHLTGVIEFHSGATITIATSFDVVRHRHSPIEIYGSEGTLLPPDPNHFTGKVELFRSGDTEWHEVPVDHPYTEGVTGFHGLRGLGAAEMVDALRAGRPHRVSAELAFHVLEVMTAFERSSGSRKAIPIHSSCGQPEPIARDVRDGTFSR